MRIILDNLGFIGQLGIRHALKLTEMARPERFELPTSWFVARHSIQLSYGRVV